MAHDGVLVDPSASMLCVVGEFVDDSPNKAFGTVPWAGKQATQLLDDAPSDKVKRVHHEVSGVIEMLKVGNLAREPVHGLFLTKASCRKESLGDKLVGMILAALAKDFSNLLELARVVRIVLVGMFQRVVAGVELDTLVRFVLFEGLWFLLRQKCFEGVPRVFLVLVGLLNASHRRAMKQQRLKERASIRRKLVHAVV